MGSVANFVISHDYPIDWRQLSARLANCTKPLLLGLNCVLRIIVFGARQPKRFRFLFTPRVSKYDFVTEAASSCASSSSLSADCFAIACRAMNAERVRRKFRVANAPLIILAGIPFNDALAPSDAHARDIDWV